MITIITNHRLPSVKCYALNNKSSSSSNIKNHLNKFQILRKELEDKRKKMLKDSFNKLTNIASVDSKFLSDAFNEIDQIHKNILEEITSKNKKHDEEQHTEVNINNNDDQNIFTKDN